MEDHIRKFRDAFDFQIFGYLVFFMIILLGAGYFLYLKFSLFWFIFSEICLGGILFVLWGFVILYYEKKGVEQNFQTEISPLIQSYLLQKQISKQELYLALKNSQVDSRILEIIQRI